LTLSLLIQVKERVRNNFAFYNIFFPLYFLTEMVIYPDKLAFQFIA